MRYVSGKRKTDAQEIQLLVDYSIFKKDQRIFAEYDYAQQLIAQGVARRVTKLLSSVPQSELLS
jgi:hypothetical protein